MAPILKKPMTRVPFDRFRQLVLLLMGMIALILIADRFLR